MLTAISVQNFRSIRDLQTLSLQVHKDEHLAWRKVIKDGKLRLVKCAANRRHEIGPDILQLLEEKYDKADAQLHSKLDEKIATAL
jgi:AAA15 family ATPase/GTPase